MLFCFLYGNAFNPFQRPGYLWRHAGVAQRESVPYLFIRGGGMKISSAVYLKRPRLALPVCFPSLTARYENEAVNQSLPPLITCQLRSRVPHGPVIHKAFYDPPPPSPPPGGLAGFFCTNTVYTVHKGPGHLWESINKDGKA